MKLQRPIGTYDLIPEETALWAALESRVRAMFHAYHYGEIRTPIFEYTELFARGVGESSDIVSKEMYTFLDRGERSLTLRPEGTAGVVRAYIENGLAQKTPGAVKLWYFAPMFRYERKQKGRYRQHVQYGCEVFGSDGPDIDLEILLMLHQFYTSLGLTELNLKLNSVGTPECRPAYREKLVAYVTPFVDELCEDCRRRLEVNPMRMFDCKNETCQRILHEAPKLIDHLDDDSRGHFERLREGLDEYGVPYQIDPHLVRGLDYYTKTAFEMSYAPLGSQGVLMGGGRYDGLVSQLGGPETPGIGFGAGMERLILILNETGKTIQTGDALDLFLVCMGDRANRKSNEILLNLRADKICCERDFTGKSMRKQFQAADKLGARFVLMLGDDEIDRKKLVLKNLKDGTQAEFDWTPDLSQLKSAIRDNGV
ncbi:MAG: histidine--tRNA ligase [bacterium]|nr:histidine--tRNA ligase [bacterium]